MTGAEPQLRPTRLPVRARCRLQLPAGEVEGYSGNLSTSGMYVRVARELLEAAPPAPGDTLPLEVWLPDETAATTVSAEVVWVDPHDADLDGQRTVGLGIRFSPAKTLARQRISTFVAAFRPTVVLLTTEADATTLVATGLDDEYRLRPCPTIDAALVAIAADNAAVLVADERVLGDRTAELFRRVRALRPHTQLVALSGGVAPPTDALSPLGRAVYRLHLPATAAELQRVVHAAVDANGMAIENELLRIELGRANERLRRENAYLRRRVEGVLDFAGIIGHSQALRRALAEVERVRQTDVTVHIRGETGTGKELIARALHANGPRATGPFVAQNCAGLTETLLQSTLFGHRRGAFTGAERDRPGVFQQAHGGTLFLDEVAELSAATQAILLRALELGEVTPVGAVEPVRVDVRVISATHQGLWQLVEEGRFRRDLFFRLMVVTVELPPLRARHGDVPLLAQHFLALHCEHYGKDVRGFSPEVMQIFERYEWPGNVRELDNEVERLVVLADAGDKIRPTLLSPHLGATGGLAAATLATAPAADVVALARQLLAADRGLDDILESLERALLSEALAQRGGNQSHAARQLRLPRQTFCSRLRRYGL